MPKVVRFGQLVCKIRQVLQKSVIIRWKWYIWVWKQIWRNWSRKLHVKEPKACVSIMIQWLTPLNLYFLFLGSSVKLSSLSLVHIGWLQMWDECGMEYSCLRTKMYIRTPVLPVSHICICVSCLWSSRFYRTPKRKQ